MLFDNHQEDLVNRALDGELTPEEHRQLEAMLGTLWESMQEVDDLLRQQPAASPPPGFAARVMAEVQAAPPPRRPAEKNTLSVPLILTLIAITGAAALTLVRAALIQLLGPTAELDELIAQLGALLNGFVDIIEWLVAFAARFPMVPAIVLASVPLAFALVWLVVYYTPKAPLRRMAARARYLVP